MVKKNSVFILIIFIAALFISGCSNENNNTIGNPVKTSTLSPGVYRSFSLKTANIGNELTVYLNVKMDSSRYYILDEAVPSGAVITFASDEGSIDRENHIKWVVFQGANDHVFSYKVIFNTTGNKAFNGIYIFESSNNTEMQIQGQKIIRVR